MSTPARPAAAAATADDDRARWSRLASTDEVAGDGPFAAAADGGDVVIVRAGGALRVFEGLCPHQGALLGEGELDGGALVCRNHRWRFDAATGQRDGGPQCLRACPVEERDGAVWADLSALARVEAAPPRRRLADLPGPRGLPLLGNALQIDLDRLHLQLEAWAREYGPLYRLKLGSRDMVVTTDTALIEQTLRERPEAFRRDGRVEPIFAELGVAGVFSAEGKAWRPQRKLAMGALSQKHLRTFYPTLHRVAGNLRARWERAADAGAEIDLLDDLMRFTVDVTTLLVFGHDVDTLGGGRDVIQRHLERFFPTFARRLNSVVPWWRVLRMPSDRRTDRAVAALRAWLGELVVAARAALAAEPARAARPANFLEAMLAARDDDGAPFDDDVIFGNLVTMLLAGEDTTANTLAWAVHHLIDLPDEVAAVRAEIAAVAGDAAVPADLDTANRLHRITGVAQEAMRLHPVAPSMFVEANHDVVLGDLELPAGTNVAGLIRPAAVDDANFADAAAFRPARWLDAERGPGAHAPSVHMPFGSGPRICPGRTLALVEMRVVLATVYQAFDVTRVGAADAVHEKFSFTVSPVGIRVRMHRRPPAA
ncbi:MAG: cytochrome P450 [Kofleriaceae bacterium]|nr:cytochrome P450 [Kofleriaceae bacterium]